jgi:tellurite resistance protein TerC
MDVHLILWGVFAAVIVGFLVVDLGYFNRQAHRVSVKSAVIQSLFWLTMAMLYVGLIAFTLGHVPAAEFVSAYFTEKMLSVDNLFVILLLFRFFKLSEKYHHRVLFWGILGAVVFRGVFIGLGAVVVEHFHFVLYLFGALLIYTGLKLLFGKEEDHADFENNRVLKAFRRYLPFVPDDGEGKFVVRRHGKLFFTLMAIVLVLIETTDIVFAVDSIPAVFAITQNPLIVFTSNIFAIMGLRALFFLVEGFIAKFKYLQTGVSFVLLFIGAKMLIAIFGVHIPSLVSLAVVLGTLVLSVVISLLKPEKTV